MHVNHHDRHRAAGDFHRVERGLHRLRQKLVTTAEAVEDVADDRRVENVLHQPKQLGVIFPFGFGVGHK